MGVFVDNIVENDICVGGWDFDGVLYVVEVVGVEGLVCWFFNYFEVIESGKFNWEVLECVGCLVDEEDVKNDVELVYFDIGFCVDRVGKIGELNYMVEFFW